MEYLSEALKVNSTLTHFDLNGAEYNASNRVISNFTFA